MSLQKVAGGTVYDPAHDIDGVVRDIWIDNGKVVAAPSDPSVHPNRVLDAAGLVVMPGGVDMHSRGQTQGPSGGNPPGPFRPDLARPPRV